MYYYAELDSNDICVGVFESLDIIEDTSYIEIDSLDDTLIGLHYDRTTGQWEEARRPDELHAPERRARPRRHRRPVGSR